MFGLVLVPLNISVQHSTLTLIRDILSLNFRDRKLRPVTERAFREKSKDQKHIHIDAILHPGYFFGKSVRSHVFGFELTFNGSLRRRCSVIALPEDAGALTS